MVLKEVKGEDDTSLSSVKRTKVHEHLDRHISGNFFFTMIRKTPCIMSVLYTGGCSVHWGFHTNSIVFPMTFPHIYHDIPRCTHDIAPVY